MRILVISYYFAPQNAMGAVRPTKLAKYWQRMGHEVTVICGAGMDGREDATLKRDGAELSDVRTLREWNPLRDRRQQQAAEPATAPKSAPVAEAKLSLKARVADAAYLYLWWLSDRSFKRKAMAELKKLDHTYDVVFSSYAPFSVHEVARAAKKRGVAKHWIADFRDEVGMSFGFQEGKKKRYLRMIAREADERCGVSEGIMQQMGLLPDARVVINGFDPEDAPMVTRQADGTLRCVYCGQFLMGRKNVKDRDLRPIFRALAALIARGELTKAQLRLVYAGNAGDTFRAYAEECELGACVELHGQVSREESLRLQAGADMLLMASYNSEAHQGILTGKVYEYMMLEKPILAYVSGDLADSALTRLIDRTGLGICMEEARGAADEERFTEALSDMLCRFWQDKPMLTSKKEAEIKRCAYPQLAAALIEE